MGNGGGGMRNGMGGEGIIANDINQVIQSDLFGMVK